jgi:hypothetical protein
MLDPNDPADRRITAFTRSFPVEEFQTVRGIRVKQGWYSYDCWGKKQGGLFTQTVEPADSKKLTGQRNYATLKLTQMGCCPPQLMKDFIEREGELVARDPVEEAMMLHKRGYFGGGG